MMPIVSDEEVEAAVNSFDSIGWAVRGCEIAVRQALEAAAHVRGKRERLETLRRDKAEQLGYRRVLRALRNPA
jgi:hypothetical protein